MLVESRASLAVLLKIGYLLKRSGLSRLGRPLLRAVGLPALAVMDEDVEEAPSRLFDEELPGLRAKGEGKNWNYFAPCGPRYLFPRVGVATWKALTKLKGLGRHSDNSCCGLFSYNYGELADARALAKRNIEKAEAAGDEPIIGDCSSCVSFLKSYPQLFLTASGAEWRPRAERFAARVKDVVEVYGETVKDLPLGAAEGMVAYHDACRALNGQGLKDQPRRAAKAVAGQSYREMADADVCCGGAGIFSFVHEGLSDELLRRKVDNAASVQSSTILTSSTSCLIQLARGLRKYYPDAKVLHLSEFVARSLEERHGP